MFTGYCLHSSENLGFIKVVNFLTIPASIRFSIRIQWLSYGFDFNRGYCISVMTVKWRI